jgi:hypothetical protein
MCPKAVAANITHGAARAGMALASASERIRLMEESLGALLLERHRRGVRATSDGAALDHHLAVIRNPFAGRFVDDLQPFFEAGAMLGERLMPALVKLLDGPAISGNPPTIPSGAQGCHRCLRYVSLPMSPVRTRLARGF